MLKFLAVFMTAITVINLGHWWDKGAPWARSEYRWQYKYAGYRSGLWALIWGIVAAGIWHYA